jgi:hypothetical protein
MKKVTLITLLPALFILGLAAASLIAVVRQAPAFSPSLRSPSIFGDWRLVPAASLYDHAAYLHDLGYGYLRADVAGILQNEAPFSDDAIYQARLARSVELFEAGLQHAPARARGWTNLALAQALAGQGQSALFALRRSWALSPNSAKEAVDRVFIVRLKNQLDGIEWQTSADRDAIQNDLEILGQL